MTSYFTKDINVFFFSKLKLVASYIFVNVSVRSGRVGPVYYVAGLGLGVFGQLGHAGAIYRKLRFSKQYYTVFILCQRCI